VGDRVEGVEHVVPGEVRGEPLPVEIGLDALDGGHAGQLERTPGADVGIGAAITHGGMFAHTGCAGNQLSLQSSPSIGSHTPINWLAVAYTHIGGHRMTTATQTQLPAGTWTLDPVHSTVGFGVKHLGINTYRGQFPGIEGELRTADG